MAISLRNPRRPCLNWLTGQHNSDRMTVATWAHFVCLFVCLATFSQTLRHRCVGASNEVACEHACKLAKIISKYHEDTVKRNPKPQSCVVIPVIACQYVPHVTYTCLSTTKRAPTAEEMLNLIQFNTYVFDLPLQLHERRKENQNNYHVLFVTNISCFRNIALKGPETFML